VQGGIHPRWNWLGHRLELWGFDPLPDIIERLSADNPAPDRLRYFQIGLGNQDGLQPFFRHDNAWGSSFLGECRGDCHGNSAGESNLPNASRVVMRRLDTLLEEGWFCRIDSLKLDCEGFELQILEGADRFLRETGVFAIESESNLRLQLQRHDPCHFVDLYRTLGHRGFEVYDLYYYRVSRPEIPGGYPHKGQPDTFDFLFLRGFGENDHLSCYSVDRLIKMIIVAELYALQDVAANLLARSASRLSLRFDVEKAIEFLRLEGKPVSAAPVDTACGAPPL
jgi:FkbM family methyltransferase